jgi:hypothetical protein
MPDGARQAHARGVLREDFPSSAEARSVMLERASALPDGVRRAPDGRALVVCTTELPGVTPGMTDWWFGWHLPETARYQLWHPLAHLKAVVKEDRSALSDDRARYIGNVSDVDEYIGKTIHRLSIGFHPPSSFGLPELDPAHGTAICARTTDRVRKSEGGRLVHLITPNGHGSVMRSVFWLGEIRNLLPLVGPFISGIANLAAVRRTVIPDQFLLDLFQHCSEEMNHLAKFLPSLYRAAHAAESRASNGAASPG